VAIVRPMTAADLDVVIGLDTGTPEAPHWPRTTYEGFLSGDALGKQIFVAEDFGTVIGFIAGHIVAGICELQSIAVCAAVRRAGIGRALLARLAEWARSQGASRVELEVRAGNHTAISFYAAAGFATDGLRRFYYNNPPDDAMLLSLVLG
jgi:[ribosomal protein S18]-alanine N-acetyltransferase